MVPQRDPLLAQMNIVPLDERRALAIVVGQDGHVENRVLDLPPGIAPAALQQATNYITARLAGRTLADAATAIRRPKFQRAKAQLDECQPLDWWRLGWRCGARMRQRRPVLIVRGQANLLDDTALMDIERVRSLIDDLENKQSIAQLLDSAREAEIDAHFYRRGKPAVCTFGFFGYRRALSRSRGQSGRRAGSDRADAVELRAGRAHRGLHRSIIGQNYRLTGL